MSVRAEKLYNVEVLKKQDWKDLTNLKVFYAPILFSVYTDVA